MIAPDLAVTGGLEPFLGTRASDYVTEPGSGFATASSVYPTLDLGAVQAHPGDAVQATFASSSSDVALLFAGTQLDPAWAISGIDGAAVLAPGNALYFGATALSAWGTGDLLLALPPSPALVGVTLFAQFVGASQPGLSNPVVLPIVP